MFFLSSLSCKGSQKCPAHRRWLHRAITPGPKSCEAMLPNCPHKSFVMSNFWHSKMSQFSYVDIWFNPFAIKFNKLHFAYTAKMYGKNYVCVNEQVTTGLLISSWKCTKSVWQLGSAWTHWGAYSAPSDPQLDLMGSIGGKRRGQGEGKQTGERETGRRESRKRGWREGKEGWNGGERAVRGRIKGKGKGGGSCPHGYF